MKQFPIVSNQGLLMRHLKRHPEFRLAAVCSCGKVMAAPSIGGHCGGSNKKWTIKAKFKDKHEVRGYTLMERKQ